MIPSIGRCSTSKMKLYLRAVKYVAKGTERIVEPFANFAYFSLACVLDGYSNKVLLNFNDPIYAYLFKLIVDKPVYVSDGYEDLWTGQFRYNEGSYYDSLKDKFNYSDMNRKALILSFLLQKSKKDFTEDKSTYGKKPKEMEETYKRISLLLKDRTEIRVKDDNVFNTARNGDTFFLEGINREGEILIKNDIDFILLPRKPMGYRRLQELKSLSKNVWVDNSDNIIYLKRG